MASSAARDGVNGVFFPSGLAPMPSVAPEQGHQRDLRFSVTPAEGAGPRAAPLSRKHEATVSVFLERTSFAEKGGGGGQEPKPNPLRGAKVWSEDGGSDDGSGERMVQGLTSEEAHRHGG